MAIHEHVVETYAKQATIYDRRFKDYLEGTLSPLLERLALRGDEKILDLACGTGELERRLFAKNKTQPVWGFDISQEMLDLAKIKNAEAPNFQIICGDSRQLPFENNQFDVITICSAFHYMREPEKVLAECARVLKPGGRFVVVDWCYDFWRGKFYHLFRSLFFPAHYNVYGLKEFKKMLSQAGLTPVFDRTFFVEMIWSMMHVEACKKI